MQLLDGSVRVYEQDLFAFERVLVAETVVPGTLTYCGDLDSFVVGETDGRVMALPYGTVRGSTGDGTLAGTANAVAQTCDVRPKRRTAQPRSLAITTTTHSRRTHRVGLSLSILYQTHHGAHKRKQSL